MPETIHVPYAILGAGAMGAATAYHLARRGEPVLLVEQFALGHDRGSSHGAARIIRHSYADLRYASRMPQAYQVWRELEAEAGMPLHVRTGGVSLCPPGVDYVARVTKCLAAVGVPHRRMTGLELRRRIPAFDVPDDTDVVFEPDAGMLSAARAVAVQVELARELGGSRTRVIEQTKIERIDLDADRPTLISGESRIVAERLIVTAGAWTGRLLPDLGVPLRPTRQQVLYLGPTDAPEFAVGRLPVFILMGAGEGQEFYGMPDPVGSLVKVARHGGPDVDPDSVSRTIDPAYRSQVRDILRGLLPGLADAPIAREEVCLYTEAPDENFLVGPLPERSDVIVASPCSGHGFKFSCLIGRILADLATRGETDLDVACWRLPN